MERIIVIFIICNFLFAHSQAQTLYAQYKVTKTETVPGPNGETITMDFDYTGKYYQKGRMSISYLVPLYLSKYPEGRITKETSANNYWVYPLVTDTMQKINYKNFDSLIWRTKTDINGGTQGHSYYFTFEPGFRKWDLLDETKTINGLKCQRAKNIITPGNVEWDVWFCPDIPVISGPDNMFELPGLMIQGRHIPANTNYTLDLYELNISIDDAIFFPSCITPSMYKKNHLKKLSN